MKFRAEKLSNVDSVFDFWDKSDPYLKFLKIREDNSYIEVKKSEVIMDNLNPSWAPIEIQCTRLVNPQKQTFKYRFNDEEFKFGIGKVTEKIRLSGKFSSMSINSPLD
jgi:hypothetical protein